jgi:ComF family protein
MQLDHALELLWPARCAACNVLIPSGKAFCTVCEGTLIPLSLQAVGTEWPATAICPNLTSKTGQLKAFSPYAYGGAIKQAILRFKHGKNRCLARSLGRLLGEAIKHFSAEYAWQASSNPLLACPVPLHPERLRQRGFNQSLELLRQACSFVMRPERPFIVSDLLRRVRNTPSLGHASRVERQQFLKGAFSKKDGISVENRQVLLIDDVMTTGATSLACSQILWAAGAQKVMILTLARTMPSFLP